MSDAMKSLVGLLIGACVLGPIFLAVELHRRGIVTDTVLTVALAAQVILGFLSGEVRARNRPSDTHSGMIRRLGLCLLIFGLGAMVIYGRTPLAAFLFVGSGLIVVEPLLKGRAKVR